MSGNDDLASVEGGGPARRVEVKRSVDAAIDIVWSAITNSAEIGEWWQRADIKKKEGGSVKVFLGDAAMVDGTIKVFQPPYILEFTWNDKDENAGLVRFDLVELNSKSTQVTLLQYVPASEVVTASAGWHSIIECLVAYLSSGKPAPFERDGSRFPRLVEIYRRVGTK